MTFVGKILVIVLMVFSIIFLAASGFVYTTTTNWKVEVDKQKKKGADLNTQITKLNADVAARKADLEAAKLTHAEQVKLKDAELAKLAAENSERNKAVTESRTSIETLTQTVKAAQAEAADRLRETTELRTLFAAATGQANAFKLRQTELNDQIAEQQRLLDAAQRNNSDLRNRVSALRSVVRTAGLSDDVKAIQGNPALPANDVEGKVTKVDVSGLRVEVSLGADDGVSVGNIFNVSHLLPKGEYLGQIRIEQVDKDHAIGRVLNNKTYLGRKIKEGDDVATKLGPRS